MLAALPALEKQRAERANAIARQQELAGLAAGNDELRARMVGIERQAAAAVREAADLQQRIATAEVLRRERVPDLRRTIEMVTLAATEVAHMSEARAAAAEANEAIARVAASQHEYAQLRAAADAAAADLAAAREEAAAAREAARHAAERVRASQALAALRAWVPLRRATDDMAALREQTRALEARRQEVGEQTSRAGTRRGAFYARPWRWRSWLSAW